MPRPAQSELLLSSIVNRFRTFGGGTRRVWFSFTILEPQGIEWLALPQSFCHHEELEEKLVGVSHQVTFRSELKVTW